MYNAYVYLLSCYSVISYYFVFIAVVRNVFCFPALEYFFGAKSDREITVQEWPDKLTL